MASTDWDVVHIEPAPFLAFLGCCLILLDLANVVQFELKRNLDDEREGERTGQLELESPSRVGWVDLCPDDVQSLFESSAERTLGSSSKEA